MAVANAALMQFLRLPRRGANAARRHVCIILRLSALYNPEFVVQ